MYNFQMVLKEAFSGLTFYDFIEFFSNMAESYQVKAAPELFNKTSL